MRDRTREHFYRMAKREGYRSRASYKLKQLNNRYRLIRRGDVVVDLGAAPGGWLQVAREAVGEKGLVLGVDVQPIEKLPFENVVTLVGDVTDEKTSELLLHTLPKPADVLLSDLSPKITGVWDVDHERSIELARCALRTARRILSHGGKMLIKVFQGRLLADFIKELKAEFDFVKVSKPEASRKRSAEVYIVATGKK